VCSYNPRKNNKKQGKEEQGRRRGKGGKKNKWGGWGWGWWSRELSFGLYHWELELSSEPMRFKHEWRFACLEGDLE
jgi:hypothetical protein